MAGLSLLIFYKDRNLNNEYWNRQIFYDRLVNPPENLVPYEGVWSLETLHSFVN